MDCGNGDIIRFNEREFADAFKEAQQNAEQLKEATRLADRHRKIVALTNEEADMLEPLGKRVRKGWMRNQPCVCGSGKKFKKCCWSKFK